MVKPKPIQNRTTGKFAGSIGVGKWIVPTPSDTPVHDIVTKEPEPVEINLRDLKLNSIEDRIKHGKDTLADVVYLLGTTRQLENRIKAVEEVLDAVKFYHSIDNDMYGESDRAAARARGAVLVSATMEPHIARWLLNPKSNNLSWIQDIWAGPRLEIALKVLGEE